MQEMKKVTSYKSSGFLWKFLLLSFILVIAFISYKIFMPKEDQNAYTYVSEPLKKGNLVMAIEQK